MTTLREADQERHLLRMRQQLAKLDLLILDEFGYVPASKAGAELLFDVIGTAYERTSVIRSVTVTRRRPASGSTITNRVAVPCRTYS